MEHVSGLWEEIDTLTPGWSWKPASVRQRMSKIPTFNRICWFFIAQVDHCLDNVTQLASPPYITAAKLQAWRARIFSN